MINSIITKTIQSLSSGTREENKEDRQHLHQRIDKLLTLIVLTRDWLIIMPNCLPFVDERAFGIIYGFSFPPHPLSPVLLFALDPCVPATSPRLSLSPAKRKRKRLLRRLNIITQSWLYFLKKLFQFLDVGKLRILIYLHETLIFIAIVPFTNNILFFRHSEVTGSFNFNFPPIKRFLSTGKRRYVSVLHNNQLNARALIGQSAIVYCISKLMEISHVFWIII